MTNKGTVKTFGWDTSVKAIYKRLQLFTTITYQDVKDWSDKRDKSSYGHQLLYSPTWSVTAVLTYTLKYIDLSLSHMYVSKRWWTYASHEDFLAPYNTTDIRVVTKWKWFELSANINNIFNKQYELIQRWPLPARQYEVSLKFNINNNK